MLWISNNIHAYQYYSAYTPAKDTCMESYRCVWDNHVKMSIQPDGWKIFISSLSSIQYYNTAAWAQLFRNTPLTQDNFYNTSRVQLFKQYTIINSPTIDPKLSTNETYCLNVVVFAFIFNFKSRFTWFAKKKKHHHII